MAQRIPISCDFELNFRCNLRCKHCYVSHGHTGIPGLEELSLVEIKRILDELAEAGTLALLLTGGEPMLRKDFKDIYLYAKRKGFLVMLYSNATLVTEQMADFLAEYPPFYIEISLYGYSRETYEGVTGIPGSHRLAFQGIERLAARRVPMMLKTVLMTLNHHELDLMQAYARQLQVNFRYDSYIFAGLVDREGPLQYRLPAELALHYELQAQEQPPTPLDVGQADPAPARRMYECGAGRISCHIDPYGQLSLCSMERDPAVDLRRFSFQEGWDKVLTPWAAQMLPAEAPCSSCSLRSVCLNCPGRARLETGDAQNSLGYMCEVSDLRQALLSPQSIPVFNGTTIQR